MLSLEQIRAGQMIAGCMRIRDMEDQQVRDFYEGARAAGINFFDHADIYWQTPHSCENRFRQALSLTAAQRDEIILQSKCGIRYTWFDFSYQHIIDSVNGSLRALGTDYLDVLLLHRPDALVEPEEVARAFDQLETEGKVRYFGVSNHTALQVDYLKTAVRQPLQFNQVQLSVTHCPLIATPMAANMVGEDQSVQRHDDMLVYAQLNDIVLQAWSPLQAGFFTGSFIDSPQYPELNAKLAELAAKYGVTPEGIAVAWITRHPARIQVVTGTTRAERLLRQSAGAQVRLSAEEWYDVFRAAGHLLP